MQHPVFNTELLEKMNVENHRLSDLAKDILQDHYACTRVWEAWSYGTMTQDDFVSCFDDVDIVTDTIASISKIEENARAAERLKNENLFDEFAECISELEDSWDRNGSPSQHRNPEKWIADLKKLVREQSGKRYENLLGKL